MVSWVRWDSVKAPATIFDGTMGFVGHFRHPIWLVGWKPRLVGNTQSRMLHDAHCDQPGSFDTALGLHPNDPKDRSSMEALIRAQVLGGKWFV